MKPTKKQVKQVKKITNKMAEELTNNMMEELMSKIAALQPEPYPTLKWIQRRKVK